jgi:hypothetical protein
MSYRNHRVEIVREVLGMVAEGNRSVAPLHHLPHGPG